MSVETSGFVYAQFNTDANVKRSNILNIFPVKGGLAGTAKGI